MAPACQPAGALSPLDVPSLPHLASPELASKPWSFQGRETGQGLCPCQAFIVPGRGGPLRGPLGRSQQPPVLHPRQTSLIEYGTLPC